MTPLLADIGFTDYVFITLIVVCFGGGATAIQRAGLRRLDRKLDALLEHQGISLPPIVSEEVQQMLVDPTKRSEAIELHGEQTGLSEEDATTDVDAFLADKQKDTAKPPS